LKSFAIQMIIRYESTFGASLGNDLIFVFITYAILAEFMCFT
jgi:hypothetical protein